MTDVRSRSRSRGRAARRGRRSRSDGLPAAPWARDRSAGSARAALRAGGPRRCGTDGARRRRQFRRDEHDAGRGRFRTAPRTWRAAEKTQVARRRAVERRDARRPRWRASPRSVPPTRCAIFCRGQRRRCVTGGAVGRRARCRCRHGLARCWRPADARRLGGRRRRRRARLHGTRLGRRGGLRRTERREARDHLVREVELLIHRHHDAALAPRRRGSPRSRPRHAGRRTPRDLVQDRLHELRLPLRHWPPSASRAAGTPAACP